VTPRRETLMKQKHQSLADWDMIHVAPGSKHQLAKYACVRRHWKKAQTKQDPHVGSWMPGVEQKDWELRPDCPGPSSGEGPEGLSGCAGCCFYQVTKAVQAKP
jgi:hypothetical protein